MAKALLNLAAVSALAAGSARGQVVLNETNLVGLPTVAAPSQYSFTASSAQALTLTLTDFQTPAAFSSLQAAVTLGDALVGSTTVDSATHVGTLAIPAATGDYTVYVIGTPDPTQGFGSFGACVAPASSAASCIAAYSSSGNILTPSTPSSTASSVLDTSFTTSGVPGTYTVTITDDAFPVKVQSIAGGIDDAALTKLVGLPGGTTKTPVPSLAAKTTYTLILDALADATVKAGLYSVLITDPTGAVVFNRTFPVGTLPASTVVDNKTTQSLKLTLTDLAYPATLASLGVAVTEGSSSLAQLTAAGTVPSFQAPAGSVEIWHYAVAGAQPGVYSLNLSGSTGSVYSTNQVVGTGPGAQSFAFVVTLPSTLPVGANNVNLTVTDFQFPATFTNLTATVAQNGAQLTQNSKGDFTAVPGIAIVLVNAQPPAMGNGIFGVTVQTSGAAPQILFDDTQAVGGVFTSQPLNLGTSGNYEVTLTDLGFPATFQDLAAVVSRGGRVLGKIIGGGSRPFSATPGQYVLTFVATPGSQNYGLYSLSVAAAAPTVSLTSNAAAVAAGGTVTLTWSSMNATKCTASGGAGWTGSQNTSGTLALVVSTTETLSLQCTGPGGSASQSVTVTATPAPGSGSGGGGSVGWETLAALGSLMLMRRRLASFAANSGLADRPPPLAPRTTRRESECETGKKRSVSLR